MTKYALPRLAGLLALLGMIILAPAAHASGNALRVSVGLFEPDGGSQYWDETFDTFTGEISDFEDTSVAVEYERRLGRLLSLVVGASSWQGTEDQGYLDFVDTSGQPILHTTYLDVESITVGLKLRLAPDTAPIIPYVGAGGGLFAWTLEESGEFIDFDIIPEEIFAASFLDDGSVAGFYATAGVEVPLGRTWSIFGEGRWVSAEDDLSGDFQGLGELDLSGQRIAAGFSWRF